MLLQSTITCPHCAVKKTEIMPTDACQFFYECTGCGTKLKPKAGDCCVFCSYGSVPSADSSGARRRTGCCLLLCVTGDVPCRVSPQSAQPYREWFAPPTD